jgi:hypothetical protein
MLKNVESYYIEGIDASGTIGTSHMVQQPCYQFWIHIRKLGEMVPEERIDV